MIEGCEVESIAERYDRRAEGFLDLEVSLSAVEGSEAVHGEAATTGVVTEAERRPTSEVPESYPVRIETREALALGIALDTDRTTTVYVEWPDEMSEDATLVRLLAALDLHPSTFADLNGERVPPPPVGGPVRPRPARASADGSLVAVGLGRGRRGRRPGSPSGCSWTRSTSSSTSAG